MNILLFTVVMLWLITAAWMQAAALAILILTLVTLILLGGAGAVVVAWLVSPRARRWIDEQITTPQQRKHDRNLAKLDNEFEEQLEDITHGQAMIDLFSDVPF